MIKIVFIDIDGTLTNPKTNIVPQSTKDAIKKARTKGIKVFVATGRNTSELEFITSIKGMDFDGYIGLNGQICSIDDNKQLYKSGLNRTDARKIISFIQDNNLSCMVFEKNRMYMNNIDNRIKQVYKKIDFSPYSKDTLESINYDELIMLSVYIDKKEQHILAKHLKHSDVVSWHELGCDIIPKGSGKHTGIELVLKHYNLNKNEVMAIGDGENDISMLKFAAIGVAMSHSNAKVKAAADVTAPPIEDDGIYKIFEQYGII